jgi:peptidoglycan/LPS O-acetylase OafA/YrhL
MGGFLQYLRPYVSMLLIGGTLFLPERYPKATRLLNQQSLQYIATISYALYIIHGGLRYTWLGEGDKIIRYLKRPLLFWPISQLFTTNFTGFSLGKNFQRPKAKK